MNLLVHRSSKGALGIAMLLTRHIRVKVVGALPSWSPHGHPIVFSLTFLIFLWHKFHGKKSTGARLPSNSAHLHFPATYPTYPQMSSSLGAPNCGIWLPCRRQPPAKAPLWKPNWHPLDLSSSSNSQIPWAREGKSLQSTRAHGRNSPNNLGMG